MTSVMQKEFGYAGRAVAVHRSLDASTDCSLWRFSDEDAAHQICLSKIGQEIQLFLSTTEVAVKQINSGSAMSNIDATY